MAISMVRILMLGFLVHVACPVVCRADTITVRKDGSANFISINEALEVLPYANGVNNVIIIGPGIYDEQLILQGEEGWNSEEFPTSEKLTDDGLKAAFESHTDRLELRGEDPLDPPVIGVKETMVERFSFFPDAATKDFSAAIVLCGNQIAIRNVEIRHTTATEHAIGGMGGNIRFTDCRFTTEGTAGSDVKEFFHIANNGDLTWATGEFGAFNEFTFEDCIWDMEDIGSLGSGHPQPFLKFAGYEFPGGLTKPDDRANGYVFIESSIIRNIYSDRFIDIGSVGPLGSGIRDFVVRGSYIHHVHGHGPFTTRGVGPLVQYDRNVFSDITGSATQGILHFASSGGNHPQGFVANGIFTDLNDNVAIRVTGGDNAEGLINIANNTFSGHSDCALVVDGGNANLTVNIGNNIFNASETAPAVGIAIDLGSKPSVVNLFNNGFWKIVFGVSTTPDSVVGSVHSNPFFDSLMVSIPEDTGWRTPPVQGFTPGSPSYIDQGDLDYYQSIQCVGPYDVDVTNNRGVLPISIGAQGTDPLKGSNVIQPICEPLPQPTITGTPTNTRSPTPSRTPTSTSTPEPTATLTPTDTLPPTFLSESSDINGDLTVDTKDLLILLEDWGKVSGP
ncbi:MAG: hypothetical protein KC944_02450 [Candidatus Omnitrophica bacterium]|nr:hypothetical protein [Candidatus Omnitrophota bacterium]